MSYQTIGNIKSASDSNGKLKALKLTKIMLHNKSVLDIGCNEGFFCNEVIKLGAVKCIGIDKNNQTINKARTNFPNTQITFICSSFEDFYNSTNEKFDVVLLCSVLHYMDGKKILELISKILNPNGMLIFEGGVFDNNKENEWKKLKRASDVVDHPTKSALEHTLRQFYSKFELIGNSVLQAGDCVPRYVYYASI